MDKKRILVVGGGFGGVRAALTLERLLPSAEITLVSEKPHFEYNPALYRYVTGNSSIEVCIPLGMIFAGRKVAIVRDRMTAIDRERKVGKGESGREYPFDRLILALGSETSYFGIEGLAEHSFGMKSVAEALRLRGHVLETLDAVKAAPATEEKVRNAHFVVIGAGATGVEMAGRLVEYAHEVADRSGIDRSLVSVSLVEGTSKILRLLPKDFTDPIEAHLREIGVTLLLNRGVTKEDAEEIYLKDMRMRTATVIWTAGVKANSLYQTLGYEVDKQGRVQVDDTMRGRHGEDVFVIGDGAGTKYAGWAQTAFYDGKFVAEVIAAEARGKRPPLYDPPLPVNAIPAGDRWAGVLVRWGRIELKFYGRIGWWFRRIADLRSFMVLLPFRQALRVWSGSCIASVCDICGIEEKKP